MTQIIDDEERDLLASFEREEWQSVPDLAREIEQYRQYAAATLERTRRVSVRLSADDLARVRQHARAAGLTDEAFIARLIHQHVRDNA